MRTLPCADERARPRQQEARESEHAEGRGPRRREPPPALEGHADQRTREDEQREVQAAVPRLPLEADQERERTRRAQRDPQAGRVAGRSAAAPDDHAGHERRDEVERVADEVLVQQKRPDVVRRERLPQRGPAVVRIEAHRAMNAEHDTLDPAVHARGRQGQVKRRVAHRVGRDRARIERGVDVHGPVRRELVGGFRDARRAGGRLGPEQRQRPAEMARVQRHDGDAGRQQVAPCPATIEPPRSGGEGHEPRDLEEHDGELRQHPEPGADADQAGDIRARRRAEPQHPVAEREQPEARDEVVLGAARLGDRHRQGRAGDRRQPSRHGTAAERPGHDGRPDDASGEREPLHEARETVAARQDVQVQDRELGSWPEPQLSQDVCRVVRDRSRLAPVRDPRHVVRHRVPVVRRRQEREGGGDREDDSHRPERETRDRQRGAPSTWAPPGAGVAPRGRSPRRGPSSPRATRA